MKQLTKGKINKIRKLILNKNGSVKSNWGEVRQVIWELMNGQKISVKPTYNNHPWDYRAYEYKAFKIMDLMGYKTESGNDSSRNGQQQNYIIKKGNKIKFNLMTFDYQLGLLQEVSRPYFEDGNYGVATFVKLKLSDIKGYMI